VGRWAIMLVALLGLLAGCFEPDVPEGDHLGPRGGGIFGPRALAPGDGVVAMIDRLENHSDETLTIMSIEPFGAKNIGRVAEVVSIELAQLPEVGPIVSLGAFEVYPPAEVRSGTRCLVQAVEPFSGFTFTQGSQPAGLAVRFRALAPGKAKIEGLRIVYEVGGERFEHLSGAGVQLKVKQNASSPRLRRIRHVCDDQVEVLR
jgi:hypothetical protein